MTEEGQQSLGDFGATGADAGDRPDAEAEAIAGRSDTQAQAVVDPEREAVPDAEGTVEIAVVQVDYTIEGSGRDEYPVVHVFGRTAENDLEHVRVRGFRPYFYAPTETLDDDKLDRDAITGTEEGYESIRGEELTRIYGRTPRDVGQMRDEFDHYEADILFPNRLLIDKDIRGGVRVPERRAEDGSLVVPHDELQPAEVDADPRVCMLDIEVDDRRGFPEDGEEPILCLTTHDSYRDEYVAWLYESPEFDGAVPEDLPEYEQIGGGSELEVRSFDSEPAMLAALLSYVEDLDPDLVSGWNCLPADSEIQMADGTTRAIREVDIGDEVVGSDDRDPTTATVTNKWKSETEVLEFDLADGSSLRTSEDHRVMVGDDESVDWKEGGEIEPGDYVLKPRTLTVEDPQIPLLRDLVPTEYQRFETEASIKEFKSRLPRGGIVDLADDFGVATGTLYNHKPGIWTPDRCEYAASEYDLALPDGGMQYRRNGISLDREITKEELYLAGLVVTDGSVSREDGIRFYNTRTELHEQFPDDSTLEPDGKGCYKQNVLDYARAHVFNGLGIPFGDKNETDVDLSTIYKMPEEYVARFLAGAMDGDGSISTSIVLAAENRTLGEWYVKLFKRLGVYAEQRENVVRIPDAERDVQRLREYVLPHMCHPEKAEALRRFEGGKSGRTENIPYAMFDPEVGSDERRIGRDKHRRDINLKRHETDRDDWGKYVFVEVETVASAGTQTTYDIETTTHDFVAEDCLVHNCDDFDIPYTLDRLEKLDGWPDHDYDLSVERLSRVGEVWRSGWGGPDVKGRVVFDLLYAYKRTQYSELESYRLDAVGEMELGVGKERYPGDIGDLWEDDPERLLEYNVRDVELCVEINHEQDVIPFWQDVASFIGCKLEDAPTPGDAVDMYVLHEAFGEFVLPSKGQQEAEDFEGGAVFDPITGVRDMVSVLDLKCFGGDTDVLTPEGERNIAELEVGDEIYTLDPDSFECTVTEVAETHEYDNEFGQLHHLRGEGYDLRVTENHRLLYARGDESGGEGAEPADFEFDAYRDVPQDRRCHFPRHEPVDGERPQTFELVEDVEEGHVAVYTAADPRRLGVGAPDSTLGSLALARPPRTRGTSQRVDQYLIPVEEFQENADHVRSLARDLSLKHGRSGREIPPTYEMSDWLELLGWYAAAGAVDPDGYRFTLDPGEEGLRGEICDLLDRMGIEYVAGGDGIAVSNSFLVEWFDDHCGGESRWLPDWVFDLDGELLSSFLSAATAGSGRHSDDRRTFWTDDDRLQRDVLDLAVRAGYQPTVTEYDDGTCCVSLDQGGSFRKTTDATVEDHDGTVYCITAEDDHVVLAGRNGRYQWVGQSLYPMSMVTINASPETKVDPEEYDGETYRTPNDVHFRKTPDGIIREMVDALLTEREEKKALRNEHDPGTEAYERFDRQQGAVKVIMNCFTPDTEVLTPDGVRNVRDLAVGDEVYSLDPDAMEVAVEPVTETHEYPDYRGDLVDLQTSKIDFRVTPNHRMLVRKNETNGISWDADDFRFVEAGDLDRGTNYELPHDWSASGLHDEPLDEVDLTELLDDGYEVWVRPDVHGHTFAAEIGYYPDTVLKSDLGEEGYVFSPEEFEEHREYLEDVAERTYVHAEAGRKWIPRTYDGDDFLDLLAWYITEGSVYTSDRKEYGDKLRGSATSVKIAQERTLADGGTGDHAVIGDLLDRMGFDYYVDDRSYQFTSKLLGDLFERRCGGDSHEKRIPDLVFECSRRQKRRFLETLIDGDGDRQPNSWRYTTASERLRDDVLRLCTHLGLNASYDRDSGSWRIYCSEDGKNTLRMNRSGGRSRAEEGVYCVTVGDNNTVLAGRNGKFQFVGNSLYGVFGWDRFRLYDREMSAGVTSTNREVISFTEQTVDDLGYSVTYGDSVTGDRPIVVRDPDGRVRIRPIAELFERSEPADRRPGAVRVDGGSDALESGKEYGRLEGWEALSLSEDGEGEWRSIDRVVRHETDESVLTLQHKFGESTTTRDHSYVVDEAGEYVEAPPEEVDEPLRIPDVPEVDTVESIDVYEVLRGYTREYEDGRSVGSENAETKVKRVHADDDRVWFGHQHHADLEKTVTVRRHVDLLTDDGDPTEEGTALVRLLAAYVSEGSSSTVETTDSRFGASISQDRIEWLEGLQSDYYRLFQNTTASIVASDTGDDRSVSYDTADGRHEVTYSDDTAKLQMMNELAAVFFREFAGQTSRGKRIPSFVFHLPADLQDLFLDVLIEGDGSRVFPRYSEEYPERNFDFETTSRELAAGLSTLLIQRGKKHSLKYRDAKDSYTIRTCDFYRSGRDPVLTERDHDGYVYDLDVVDNDNFVDGVGGVVLHNTDSVMIELGQELSKDEAIDTSFDIEEAINQSYDEFTQKELNAEDHRFQIEFEKLYRRFFQAGKKKRYAGHIVWKEGKDVDDIDITGFEYQRSDIAPITKRVQREVIEMIVTGEDIADVKDYVADVIEDFKAGNVDLDDVGIPGGIGKRLDAYDTDTAQVRGAKYANLLFDTNFGRGSKPKRLYLEKNGIHPDYFERIDDEVADDPLFESFKRDVADGDGVICFEYADQVPEEFAVDWDKMLDKTLKGPIARVLEALDVSWEEVETGQQQTGLGNFM